MNLKDECLVCLSKESTLIDVFGETGIKLEINIILKKHFWFECNRKEKNEICFDCWNIIRNFNSFYDKIARIHDLVNITIKTEAPIEINADNEDIEDNVYDIINDHIDDMPEPEDICMEESRVNIEIELPIQKSASSKNDDSSIDTSLNRSSLPNIEKNSSSRKESKSTDTDVRKKSTQQIDKLM